MPVDERPIAAASSTCVWGDQDWTRNADQNVYTSGRLYREMAHEWVEASSVKGLDHPQVVTFRKIAPVPLRDGVSRGALAQAFDSWPRLAQVASLGIVFCATIFVAGHTISAALGLAIGFCALSMLFLGSLAAHRRGTPERLFGPNVSLLGMWASLVVVVAICVNAATGS
jgi:hypothetical protein